MTTPDRPNEDDVRPIVHLWDGKVGPDDTVTISLTGLTRMIRHTVWVCAQAEIAREREEINRG